MDANFVIKAVLTLIAGIGIFLIGCTLMSTNLESIGSTKLKSLFSKASKSKALGVGIGALGTAAIQSSGATTAMVIGFVNAGIMALPQAATVIYGANIGTTITGQIVALGMFGSNAISTTVIFSALAGVGAFITLFAKKDFLSLLGKIVAGFGMLFVGLSMMSSSMSSFAEMDEVKAFLATISNAILLVVIGALITAVIQSSSVMTSVAITMVVTGLISLDQGIFLTMGSNIGSCVVAIIAGMSSGRNAKRTALIHLIFNVAGVVLFMIIGEVISLCTGGDVTFGSIFAGMFPGAPQTQLAMFHTVFNVITVLIITPLNKVMVNLVTRLIPDKHTEKEDNPWGLRLYFIDDNMLKTPPVAIKQVKSEIENMADIAIYNFNSSCSIAKNVDFKDIKQFRANEHELNFLNRNILDFLIKLLSQTVNEKDRRYITSSIKTISDLERIGDYAENILEYAEKLKESGTEFSPEAKDEIDKMLIETGRLYKDTIMMYHEEDLSLMDECNKHEENIDNITKEMVDNHIGRVNAGQCDFETGSLFMSLAADAERVGDHIYNVAKSVADFAR